MFIYITPKTGILILDKVTETVNFELRVQKWRCIKILRDLKYQLN
jgi:hypothetical protein